MAVLIANNATGRLAGSIDSTQVTVSLQAGEGSRFPSPAGNDWFPITLVQPDGDLEIMHCTGRVNDMLTVQRGMEGTSAKTFSAGDRCALRVTAAAYEDLRAPKGVIIKWSGAIVDIPTGWGLCDGTNGTIDLTDRFVVGAGNTYVVGATGGANTVTLTEAQLPPHVHGLSTDGSHNHTMQSAGNHNHSASTNSTGYHSHTYTRYAGKWGAGSGTEFWASSGTYNTGGNGTHSHTVSVGYNGSHVHTIDSNGAHSHTVASTGGGASHENRPPYYALAFIQKL